MKQALTSSPQFGIKKRANGKVEFLVYGLACKESGFLLWVVETIKLEGHFYNDIIYTSLLKTLNTNFMSFTHTPAQNCSRNRELLLMSL